jgi:dTDP-4-dehydrorhamnose reductase
MSKRSVFVVGSRGQLGRDLMTALVNDFDLAGADLPEIDITNADSTADVIRPHNPDVIVNSAAFTDVDACETEHTAARAVNVDGPRNLADLAQAIDATLIHVSTDYVFDGQRQIPEPYRESDTPDPRTSYGHTKREGERAALAASDRVVIARAAWLYGFYGNNFIKTMLRLALEDSSRTLKVVDDQHGCPTWSGRLAEQIAALVTDGNSGIYHAVGEGHCSWYTFAGAFLELMRVEHDIAPCTTAEYPRPAPRPANSILMNERLSEEGINKMRPWRDDLELFVRLHRDALMQEAGKALARG